MSKSVWKDASNMPIIRRVLTVAAIGCCVSLVCHGTALADPTTLICKLQPGQVFMQKLGWNNKYSYFTMKVDAKAGTVTNMGSGVYGFCQPADNQLHTESATFTDTEIAWRVNVNGVENDCSLNRLTLYFVQSWNDTDYGWMDWEGPCTKATQQV